jgi:hypothetical protein
LPDGNLALAPHFLTQKFPARTFAVETLVDLSGIQRGEIAGLAIVGGKEYAALALRLTINGLEFVFMANGQVESIGYTAFATVRLRVAVAPDGTFTFSMATAAGPFAGLTRIFRASEGGWIGARAGLFSLAAPTPEPPGFAEFDYFRLSHVPSLPDSPTYPAGNPFDKNR